MKIALPDKADLDLTGRPLILSYSGGKDSGATWLALRENGMEPDHVIYADTGWEHPWLYQNLETWEQRMGKPITRVQAVIDLWGDQLPAICTPRKLLHGLRAGDLWWNGRLERGSRLNQMAEEVEAILGISPSPMVRRILKYASFPTRVQKWCTSDLKSAPCDAWVDANLERPDLAVHVTGVRADESRKRALYPVTERHSKTGQWHWRPILNWSVGDVIDIHRRHNMPLCPIYDLGVDRVGCWPCIPARKKAEVAALDDRRIAAIRLLELYVGQLSEERRKVTGHGKPGMLHFELADFDGIPDIDTAVSHARTFRGEHRSQGQLFAPAKLDMCSRWGLCETGGIEV